MKIPDFISKRTISHPSLNDNEHKKTHKLNHSNQNQKLKRLHISISDLLHGHRSTNNLEINNIPQQQHRRPSIIKSSDITKTLTKKSVTFASVSDLVDKEHDKDDIIFNLQTNINNEIISEEDLVTVIPNKQINDEIIINSNKNTEPYPFRSEISLSLSSQLNSPIDIPTTSHHSQKKIIHHFIYHRHPKKLRHPIKTIDPVSTIHRSSSAPDILFSSPSSLSPTITVKTNNQQRSFKTIRTWFKSSSLGRFLQSFRKHSHKNQNKISKPKIDHQSTEFSQYIY